MSLATIQLREACLDWSRLYVAGVLNVTPDSFSDGGAYLDPEAAVARARALVAAGADIIDIGGESTRPGAAPVDERSERQRVLPVIEALRAELKVPLSIDTWKSGVAREALAAGAELVNDISGGLFDPAIVRVCADAGAVFLLGHVCARPGVADLGAVHAAESAPPSYAEVERALRERVAALPDSLRARTIVDPGLGFGKRLPQNLELMRRAGQLGAALGCPIMLGPSRKRFIAELCGDDARDMALRDRGTVGACLAAAASGAQLVRVHDVAGLTPALRVFEAARGSLAQDGGGASAAAQTGRASC